MRTFNYLIEIILVISLILVYVTTIRFPSSPSSYISDFNKKYLLYSGLGSTYNNNFLSYIQTNQFDIISYLYYWLFSGDLSYYDLKMSFYYPINFYNLGNYSCYEFLFPFPYLGSNLYYTQPINGINQNFFLIYNENQDLCGNFTSTLDWNMLIVNYYTSNNISLYLNVSNLINNIIDPYSFFAYNINLYPIQISYLNVSYVSTNLGIVPVVNLSLNLPPNYNSPIIIIFRSENKTYNFLNFNNYQLVNNLPAQYVSYSYSSFGWETLYVSPRCFDSKNILTFTNNDQFLNLTNSSYYPSTLSGNTSITIVAWIYVNSYYSSSCADGENYVSALATIPGVNSYPGSTFRQILLPINGQYYIGVDESSGVGYLPNYPIQLGQWIFVFWIYNNSDENFYGGFINQTGLYYGRLQPASGFNQLYPLNLYYPPNETLYLGTPTSLYSPVCSFLGSIYVIAFYNKALSINQIENIYYSEDFEQYNPVLIYYGYNYNPNTGILYGNNQNYNLQAYNNPVLVNSILPYDQLIIDYSIPPNYQDQIQSSNINISYCYPVPTYYPYPLIPSIQYDFWDYFGVSPVPNNYKFDSSIVFPYGLGFSKFTIYGS